MKSLLKAIETIDAVAEAGRAGISEISSTTGFPPSTIHRIAATLVKKNYFQQDPITKRYSLSFRFLELGTRVQQQTHLTSIARPHLERLMAETHESINLAVPDGDSAVYLDIVQSSYAMLQLFTRPGARVPLYATGVGKIFLSRMSGPQLEGYLKRVALTPFTRHTITDRVQIIEELNQIRTRGFAVDNQEMEAGVRCLAALILDHDAQPAAAVSISGAAMRITPDRVEHFGQIITSCALTISRELGYNP